MLPHALLTVALVIAAIAATVDVESILGTFPALTCLGLIVALFAARRRRAELLLHGLTAALVAAGLAMAIGIFSLGPGVAEDPVAIALWLAAVASAIATYAQFGATSPPVASPATTTSRRPIRFNMRTMLVVTTVLCIGFAVIGLVNWRGEYPFFAAYGLVVTALAALVAYYYAKPRLAPRNAPDR